MSNVTNVTNVTNTNVNEFLFCKFVKTLQATSVVRGRWGLRKRFGQRTPSSWTIILRTPSFWTGVGGVGNAEYECYNRG